MSRYRLSELHLKRAEMTIPLGSQTFSKSRIQYPVGAAPLFAKKAKGAFIWDLDGNKYIDYVSGLACITLGYGDKGVERAIKRQLSKGISMSLPGKLEAEVAEKLVEMIPSAEMVRFGKNGTDATSAAIRLARAFTGKDHVLVCGYLGWQDWYIASTTRNKGVPDVVGELTHKFNYNDIESLNELILMYESKIAAVILEPMNVIWPNENFLHKIRDICSKNGIVLIFDETITGFRFANGGAQELFGVTPDLSTFGKGMANGMPISAVVGRFEIMKEMEEIFFSGTFGGELLSLAATNEVLDRLKVINLPEILGKSGDALSSQIEIMIQEFNLDNVLSISGHPTWRFLNWRGTDAFTAEEIKTYFAQLMYENGVLILSTHNMTLAHTQSVRARTLSIYQSVLRQISLSIQTGTLRNNLRVNPLMPVFKLR
jgi:glutamate-1-semialdehyde 2,1-aminomutase